MRRPLLEIAVDNAPDAIAAARAGADRLELVADLAAQGLTAPPDLIRSVASSVAIPVVAMIRPHEDDAAITDADFDRMLADTAAAIEAGARGIVFGILTSTGHIDRRRTAAIVRAARSAGDVETVVHRAFDFTPDAPEALEELVSLGVSRILTAGIGSWSTGGDAALPARRERVAALVRQAAGRIQILCCGGIRPGNAVEWLERTGCDQVHSACRPSGGVPCSVPARLDPGMVASVRREIDRAE
ncbi:MAG: copper homeostasis protein CutC [Planctomycetes bacterium]|nr:copper homeostasis protein CutC [Planctomycetota bacterium]